jgi:Transposase, Mutator family
MLMTCGSGSGGRTFPSDTANILDALPKSAQPAAKRAVQEIYNAEDKEHAHAAINAFAKQYGAKYPKVVKRLTDDEEELLAFFDFPAEHWIQSIGGCELLHMRSIVPACHRTARSASAESSTAPRRRTPGLRVSEGQRYPLFSMELQDVQELSNFFERRVSAYQKNDSRRANASTPGPASMPARRYSTPSARVYASSRSAVAPATSARPTAQLT